MTYLWRNKKNGRVYELLGHALEATNSRNGLWVAIYRRHGDDVATFVRELKEFEEKFEALPLDQQPERTSLPL